MNKINLFSLVIVYSFISPSTYAANYWGCRPQAHTETDPQFIIAKGEAKQSAIFILDKDLVREQGKLPAGQYQGVLEPSASGFSLFAKLEVEKYFPNHFPNGKGTWLVIALSTKANLFASEAYLLWEQENGVPSGLILNEYGCRGK